MLTIPVLKLLFQIKTRGSAEKLPSKDLHSLLCLQLLGCRQEGKLFLLQHNSGEWKISPSWSLCKRPCDGQGGSLWTKKLSSGTGTTGGASRGQQGALARRRRGIYRAEICKTGGKKSQQPLHLLRWCFKGGGGSCPSSGSSAAPYLN